VSVRVVRTFSWSTAGSDAHPIKPRLDVTACPYASPGVLRFTLDLVEFSLRILRPIQCETVANEPFAEIDTVDRTRRHRPPVLVQRDRDATNWLARNEGVDLVRHLRSAPILQAVFYRVDSIFD
jgi:hypothetical protein